MAIDWRKALVGDLGWRRLLGSVLGIYACFAVALWVLADRLIFLPHEPGYRDDARMRKLALPDGTRITAAWLPRPGAAFAILYSHGNAEDLGDVLPTLETLHGLGFAVLGYDYPGYGTSGGSPSSEGAIAAAHAAYDHLVRELRVPPGRIIAHGRSIGGGPTMALAADRPLGGLVLESTFTSIREVRFAFPVVPFDKFRSREALAKLRLPTLVIHGKADPLIAFAHGEALYAAAPGPKAHLWVEGAGHDDVQDYAGPAWGEAIAGFARSIGGSRIRSTIP
jgi:fermentation-respiration switch protein FrsA (DUF1100 family)